MVVVGPRVRPEGLNRPQRTRRRFYYKKYRSYSVRQRLQELVGSSLYIDLRLYLFQCHVESRSYDWTAFVPPRGGTRLPANVTFSVKRAECSKKERNRIPMGIISSGRSFVPTVGHRRTGTPVDSVFALVTWFQDVFERKGMRRPNHTEGEVQGDLPHPLVLDYAAAGI